MEKQKPQFEVKGRGLLVRAPAKINLSLLIAGKRPDGFHEIETIMTKVSYFDEILIQQGQQSGIELICQGQHWAPAGHDNLIYKAAESLLARAGKKTDIKVTLTKNIPAGSGLGSASSDAAATLMGLNKYMGLAFDKTTLWEIATDLGSDVPFFLNGSLAICGGKGENITKIAEDFDFIALLLLPNVSVSTKKVYEAYKHDHALYTRFKTQINENLAKNRIDLIVKICANMLENWCFELAGELGELKKKARVALARPVCLSGSGSAMFCIVENMDIAVTLRDKVAKDLDCKSIIVCNNKW